jgi:DivIVA domain-containing protein
MTAGPGEGVAGTPGSNARITPLDIQQKEFRVSRFGGYRMRDVDEFLDHLTEVVSEMVEENGRLRRQMGAAPVVGSPDLDDVARQADEIIQRARDEAARITADARRSSGSGTPSPATDEDREAVKAFLQQERAFLQELAGLVQGHAETVKGMVRSARRTDAPDAAGPTRSMPPAAEEEATSSIPDADAVEASIEEHGKHAAATSETEAPVDDVVQIEDPDPTQTLPATDEDTELAQTRPSPAAQDRGGDGDASLRELFWGEDD